MEGNAADTMLAFLLGLIALMAQLLGPARLSWLSQHIGQLSSKPELAASSTAAFVSDLEATAASFKGAGVQFANQGFGTGRQQNIGSCAFMSASWTNSL